MRYLVLAFAAALATPAAAVGIGAASPLTSQAPRPTVLAPAEAAAYRAVFAAMRVGDRSGAERALDALSAGVLTPVARAELLLAPDAAPADPLQIANLLATAPQLPQAPALLRMARAGGLDPMVALPAQQALRRQPAASKRIVLRSTRGDAAAAQLAARAAPLVKVDDAIGLETLVESTAALLTPEALTEWRARTAWCYYLIGDDANARRVAALAHDGAGDWVAQASWTAGLAAWRTRDYAPAVASFAETAALSRDAEMTAAGYFWSARALTASGQDARQQLAAAARYGETFYGMLAYAQLGPAAPLLASTPIPPNEQAIAALPNVRAAIALVEIGETGLADQLLRQQARIGRAQDHAALVALAGQLGLPATEVWLAQNCPAGAALPASARFPMPAWSPSGGWRVDRALLFAHALQESQFRVDATSPAGARGLMQLMPATARLVARHKGLPESDAARLDDPASSLEFGQSYLQELADASSTGGLLPKVIAAYNAGPRAVAGWNGKGCGDDPLLFIESIPYTETRGYVTVVLRNYWMYQRQAGAQADSLTALASGQWPRFPVAAGLPLNQTASAGTD